MEILCLNRFILCPDKEFPPKYDFLNVAIYNKYEDNI